MILAPSIHRYTDHQRVTEELIMLLTSYAPSSAPGTLHAVQPFGQNDNLAAALLAASSLWRRLASPEAAASAV